MTEAVVAMQQVGTAAQAVVVALDWQSSPETRRNATAYLDSVHRPFVFSLGVFVGFFLKEFVCVFFFPCDICSSCVRILFVSGCNLRFGCVSCNLPTIFFCCSVTHCGSGFSLRILSKCDNFWTKETACLTICCLPNYATELVWRI
jgi:hypothetical protein